jgi:hypothetical protein
MMTMRKMMILCLSACFLCSLFKKDKKQVDRSDRRMTPFETTPSIRECLRNEEEEWRVASQHPLPSARLYICTSSFLPWQKIWIPEINCRQNWDPKCWSREDWLLNHFSGRELENFASSDSLWESQKLEKIWDWENRKRYEVREDERGDNVVIVFWTCSYRRCGERGGGGWRGTIEGNWRGEDVYMMMPW